MVDEVLVHNIRVSRKLFYLWLNSIERNKSAELSLVSLVTLRRLKRCQLCHIVALRAKRARNVEISDFNFSSHSRRSRVVSISEQR